MYVTKDSKKQVKYSFWSRPTISYKVSCEKEHPRDKLYKAAVYAKASKDALNEMGVIVTSAIGYSVGFLAAFVITVMFLIGSL